MFTYYLRHTIGKRPNNFLLKKMVLENTILICGLIKKEGLLTPCDAMHAFK